MSPSHPELIVLCGTTGSGKTDLVTNLSSEWFEVVSFDSRQVYKDIPIGTSAPTPDELQKMPHHMVGILSAQETLNAKEYSLLAAECTDQIRSQGKIPLLVAGTGFYLKAFLYGMYPVPIPSEDTRRYVQSLDLPRLREELEKRDPQALEKIAKNDVYRYRRALELAMSGVLYSSLGKEREGGYLASRKIQNWMGFYLSWERAELHKRLALRLEKILLPMAEETERVLQAYGENCPALQTLGYKFALDFIQGKISIESFYREVLQAHKNYAKKQSTWFRKQPHLQPVVWSELLETLLGIQKSKEKKE